jgi:hypothetical protein
MQSPRNVISGRERVTRRERGFHYISNWRCRLDRVDSGICGKVTGFGASSSSKDAVNGAGRG